MKATLLAVTAVVCAANATAGRRYLMVSPDTVRAGETVTISGSAGDCRAGNTVFVLSRAFGTTHEFAGVPAVLARVRPGGQFRSHTRIPGSRRPGRYAVTARCGGGNLGVTAHLRVTGAG